MQLSPPFSAAAAPVASQIIAAGRGEGRTSRRRKRQQVAKERDQAKRAVKVGLQSCPPSDMLTHQCVAYCWCYRC